MRFDPEVVDGVAGGCQDKNGEYDTADHAYDAGTAAFLQKWHTGSQKCMNYTLRIGTGNESYKKSTHQVNISDC